MRVQVLSDCTHSQLSRTPNITIGSEGDNMAVRHDTISEFDHKVEDWKTYVERVNLSLTANDITDRDKKRAVLLSVCGARTYHTIRGLVAPSKLTDLAYDEIGMRVQEHYNPILVVTVQRYKFNSRVCQPEESVAKFVAALRHLGIHCDYGDSLNNMLRDRLICGITDARIQQRLLAETKVDFKRVMEITQAMETADRDATHLQGLQKELMATEAAVHVQGL